jgi:hypothetical protein
MKIKTITMTLLVCLCTLGFGQQDAPRRIEDFRIDSTKPYVYLQVLSVGPRKPLEPGEPDMGIRLRLVNNSRVPISIITLSTNEEQKVAGYNVIDEVIPDTWGVGDDPGGGATGVQHDQKSLTGIIRWPNQTEQEIRGAEAAARGALAGKASSQFTSRPYGYNDQRFLGRRYLTIIRPGDAVTFSYPSNHISEMWHLEVPFRLALPSTGSLRPPYSYVALYWIDLSESDRTRLKNSAVRMH